MQKPLVFAGSPDVCSDLCPFDGNFLPNCGTALAMVSDFVRPCRCIFVGAVTPRHQGKKTMRGPLRELQRSLFAGQISVQRQLVFISCQFFCLKSGRTVRNVAKEVWTLNNHGRIRTPCMTHRFPTKHGSNINCLEPSK